MNSKTSMQYTSPGVSIEVNQTLCQPEADAVVPCHNHDWNQSHIRDKTSKLAVGAFRSSYNIYRLAILSDDSSSGKSLFMICFYLIHSIKMGLQMIADEGKDKPKLDFSQQNSTWDFFFNRLFLV